MSIRDLCINSVKTEGIIPAVFEFNSSKFCVKPTLAHLQMYGVSLIPDDNDDILKDPNVEFVVFAFTVHGSIFVKENITGFENVVKYFESGQA